MLGFNAQTIFLSMFLILFSIYTHAQEVEVIAADGNSHVVDVHQLEQVSKDLNDESEKQDGKLKKTLKAISAKFKSMAEKLKKNGTNKRKKITLDSILMGAGRGATFLSIQTARPFVNASGFIKGFFEKPSKNEQEIAFMQLFLKYEDRFSDIWQRIDHISNFELAAVVFEERVNQILEEKKAVITKDLELYFSDKPEDINNESIIAFINQHDEYQDLKPILGELNTNCLSCLEELELFADPMKLINASHITLVEGVSSFALKTFVPKIVVSIVSKSLAGSLAGIGLVADAGMLTSALMCTVNEKVITQINQGDEELKDFCKYVVNKSAYQISLSRMRGYNRGKQVRRKYIQETEKVKIKLKNVLPKKQEMAQKKNI